MQSRCGLDAKPNRLEETLAESVRVPPELLDLPSAEISADLAGDHAQRGERLLVTHKSRRLNIIP